MRQTTHKLYWCHSDVPQCSLHTDLSTLLRDSEALRRRAAAGEPITYIASASEYGEEITNVQGVGVVDADYDWKKRRK